MTTLEFANRYLHPYKTKGHEIIPTLCPYCNGGQHRDKSTFALNVVAETFNCRRGTCGKQGSFAQLCEDFGEQADRSREYAAKKPAYKKPSATIQPLSEAGLQYLSLRKLSPTTLRAYNISSDGKGNLLFPFYENQELVFVKYRPARKLGKGEQKAWREKDTKPVLFGMHLCDPAYPLCVYEGEIDAMSGYEAGIKNCVSVPSGAEDLTWVDTCWEWLKLFKGIYLFGDNDAPGKEMIRKLSVRLIEHELYIVEHEFKDCNDLLYRKGPEAVLEAYKKARPIPVAGLLNLSDITTIDVKNLPKVSSGMKTLDEKIGGFMLGDLSVWTGRRGEGKSTLMGQIMLNAIEAGHKVCAYSGELRADRFQYWINLQAAGRLYIRSYNDGRTGKTVHYVESPHLEKITAWYNRKFWLYDNQTNTEALSVLKAFELAACRYGCDVFLVDNLMTARSTIVDERDYYRAQSNFVGQLVEFANRFNTHVHLVCHPKKTGEKGIGNEDIAGSGDITNRAANVFSLEKLNGTDRMEQGFDLALTILKNRWEGVTGLVALNYDPVSRRMKVPSEPELTYSWSKAEWPLNDIEEEDVPW